MAAELPDGYYLRNFLVLAGDVEARYSDILSESERLFLDSFRGLPGMAARLYVRLIMRKGPLFRSDKLRYTDIPDVTDAISVLVSNGFLRSGGAYDVSTALSLLTLPELRESFSTPVGLRKADAIGFVAESISEAEIRDTIDLRFSVVEPLRTDAVEALRLLFFGNLGQDFTEFVVTELGHVRYENYRLDRGNRPFRSRDELDASLLTYGWRTALGEALERDDRTMLTALANEVIETALPDTAMRRRDLVLNEIARQLERDGKTADALEIYATTRIPPSRERRARISSRSGRHDDASRILNEIIDTPNGEDEAEFATTFMNRMARKHGAPYRMVDVYAAEPPTETLFLEQVPGAHVEELCLQYHTETGYQGAWCENALMNGLFGLMFWDIVFAPVPRAFHNRFQRGPSDLLRDEFRSNRRSLIDERLAEVGSSGWTDRIVATFDEKQGYANYFVDWKRLPRELVKTALDRIPPDHFRAVFDRLCNDVGANSSGFPDLVLFSRAGDRRGNQYILVEVKGPGDQLQKNQVRWMRFFAQHGIPHQVERVRWVEGAGSGGS